MQGYIGEIRMFGGNFAPRQWALCQGQLLAISQNAALFSILGTTYGGDGRTSFALPDMRGRAPLQQGNGPGLSDRRLGEKLGTETVTLNTTQIPSHNHTLSGTLEVGEESKTVTKLDTAAGNYLGNISAGYRANAGGATLKAGSVTGTTGNTGGNLDHNNMQPSLAVNFIICLTGIFPSRN